MILKRRALTWWERLYLPALIGGFRVTLRHLFRRKVTLRYPEEKPVVPPGYRGAPYLVRDEQGNTKCVSCQLCEFICPPKAIKITPPGPVGPVADRSNAEKMPREFEIDMLRCIFCGLCQEVCPEEAIFLMDTYSLNGLSREQMVFNKERLLALGGTHVGIQKWTHKLEEARAQEDFPVAPA